MSAVRCPDCSAAAADRSLAHDEICPLGLAIDAFSELDRLWFKEHRGETGYVRPITWAEQQEQLMFGFPSILLIDARRGDPDRPRGTPPPPDRAGGGVTAKAHRALRWFRKRRAPLGYTATYGASGHYKVRDPEGRYVATISGSPRDPMAPEREVTRILQQHEQTRSTS